MALQIFYGTQPVRLVDTCLDSLAKEAHDWPEKRAFILVPEHMKAETEKRFLNMRTLQEKARPNQALMLVDVVSFQRLAHRLLSDIGALSQDYLDKASKLMLYYRILRQEKKDFMELSFFSDRIGFMAEIDSVIGDFERYHVDSETLLSLDASHLPPSLYHKLTDLGRLMQREKILRDHLHVCDIGEEQVILDDILGRLIESPDLLNTWPYRFLDYLKKTSFWVLGFGQNRDFTPQEWRILEKLERLSSSLTVTVCADKMPQNQQAVQEGEDAFFFGRKTLLSLRENFINHRMTAVQSVSRIPELDLLTSAYLSRSKTASNIASDAIEQLRFHTREEELSYVAGKIREMVVEQGYRYRDIRVVLCDPEGYKPTLNAVFSAYGLDPFLDMRRTLAETVFVRFILSLLDLSVFGWSHETMMTCLRSGMCHVTAKDADRLENFLLKYGLSRGWQIFFPRAFDSLDDPEKNEMQGLIKRVLLPIKTLTDRLSDHVMCADKAKVLLDFLEHYGPHEQDLSGVAVHVRALSREWLDQNKQDAAVGLTSSYASLCSWLMKLTGPLGQTELSTRDFRNVILRAMEGVSSGQIPSFVDQLDITDLDRGYQTPCRALFLLGASRDRFPYRPYKEGYLRSDERQSLEKVINRPFPNRSRDQLFSDSFTAYALLACPTDRLILACSQEQEPSSLFGQLAELFPSNTPKAGSVASILDPRLFAPQMLERYSLFNPSDMSDARRQIAAKLQYAFKKMGYQPTIGTPLVRQFDHVLSQHLLDRVFSAKIKMSASRMEAYANCPFAYFAKHMLGLKEREIFCVRNDNFGLALHFMMERAFFLYREDLAKQKDKRAVTDAYLEKDLCGLMRGIFIDVQKAYPHLADKVYGVQFGERLIRICAHAIRHVLIEQQEKAMYPNEMEWAFDDTSATPMTLYIDDDHQAVLSGFVDRVDYCEDGSGFRVIDYKSSDRKIDYDELYQGLCLQLPIYLEAYRINHPTLMPLDAGYFHLHVPMVRAYNKMYLFGDNVKQEQVKKMRMANFDMDDITCLKLGDLVQAKVRDIGKRLLSGDVSAAPAVFSGKEDRASCRYCTAKGICHIDPSHPPFRYLKRLDTSDASSKNKSKEAFCDYLTRLKKESDA